MLGDQLRREIEQMRGQLAQHRSTTWMVLLSPPDFMIGNVGGFLAVDADDVVLKLAGVLGLADIAHGDPAVPDGFDGHGVQIRDVLTRLLE